MSESFTFDTKLNDYKKIGLSVSGGIDSALLLYYLLKSDISLTCYTMVDISNKVNNNIEAAKYVVNLMETKTSKSTLGHIFQDFTITTNKDKRLNMREYYKSLIDAETIDCLILGTTQDLSEITEPSYNSQRDTSKLERSEWDTVNNVYRPFLKKDKSWIKTCCDSCGLTKELVSNTMSCVSMNKTAPCKDCLWCAEKYAVFSSY